jgi:hypothetical protein
MVYVGDLNRYKNVFGTPKRNRPLWKWSVWEYNIKIGLKEMRIEDV